MDVSPSLFRSQDVSPLNFRSWAFLPLDVEVQIDVLPHLGLSMFSQVVTASSSACINRPYTRASKCNEIHYELTANSEHQRCNLPFCCNVIKAEDVANATPRNSSRLRAISQLVTETDTANVRRPQLLDTTWQTPCRL